MQQAIKLSSARWILSFGLVVALGQCWDSLRAEPQSGPGLVPICDVLNAPEKFDRQSIQLRGNVRLAFEDFSLHSPACPDKWPGIWLSFAGDVATPTMSTANDTVRRPGYVPSIGGAPILLTKDDNFERFFTLISARHKHDPYRSGPLYKVTATLTGIFLAGNRKLTNGQPEFPGYGHMGSFYLFVITRVDSVDSDPAADLGVSGSVNGPDGKPLFAVDVFSQTVNCCQPWVDRARSDDDGFFTLKNAGQVLTFIKAGYGAKSVVVEKGDSALRVTLDSKPGDDWQIPPCEEAHPGHLFRGLPLSLSTLQGLHSERVSSRPDPLFVIHGSRYQLIRLFKNNLNVPYGETAARTFASEEFTQRNIVDASGKQLGIDSQGREQNQIFWRVLAMPGLETVEFRESSSKTADLFNEIIDSACLQGH
jgi:hypothetical protein